MRSLKVPAVAYCLVRRQNEERSAYQRHRQNSHPPYFPPNTAPLQTGYCAQPAKNNKHGIMHCLFKNGKYGTTRLQLITIPESSMILALGEGPQKVDEGNVVFPVHRHQQLLGFCSL